MVRRLKFGKLLFQGFDERVLCLHLLKKLFIKLLIVLIDIEIVLQQHRRGAAAIDGSDAIKAFACGVGAQGDGLSCSTDPSEGQ